MLQHIKVIIQNYLTKRGVLKALSELHKEEVKNLFRNGGNLENVVEQFEELKRDQSEEKKFFKQYFG